MATSRSVNRVILVGNLTRDPAMRSLPNGAFITTFGIATNKTWRTVDGKSQEKAVYLNIVCWNKLAEISSEILQLGMLVYIEGELTSMDVDINGTRVTKYEIRASDMKIMDAKGKKGVGREQALANGTNGTSSNVHHDTESGSTNEETKNIPSISSADIEVPSDNDATTTAAASELF